MKIPTREDFIIYNSLDEISAYNHFFNKTLEGAELLFRDNAAYYQEDLMWMGHQALKFYLIAVYNYLISKFSTLDSHFIYCLYEIFTFRSKEKDFHIYIYEVNRIVDYIIENYQKFEVEYEIYGELLQKYTMLKLSFEMD